jgi:hypothetical protein
VDQGDVAIPATIVSLTDDGIALEFGQISARYEGHLTGADTLAGTFTQGAAFPLEFKRGDLYKPSPYGPCRQQC